MGHEFPVNVPLNQAKPEDFDALLLPGGVINPDTLRIEAEGGSFRESLLRCRQAGRFDLPRAMDHHRGRRSARPPHDIVAFTQDRSEECRRGLGGSGGGCGQRGLVTSRSPDDIPAFNPEVIRLFAGARGKQRAA